jgi:Uma2 family endonuclease
MLETKKPFAGSHIMIDEALITAERFAEIKYDLPENGRWTELLAGRIVTLQPPDDKHGNVVLNLSKAMAETYQAGSAPSGMACFDVGILVHRDPDTIYSPAMSYFSLDLGFAPVDEVYTDRVPLLVCEVASSNDRRRNMADRVLTYLERGVDLVWVMDPIEKRCHVHGKHQTPKKLEDWQTLDGGRIVSDFRITVGNLFADPKWWK